MMKAMTPGLTPPITMKIQMSGELESSTPERTRAARVSQEAQETRKLKTRNGVTMR
jgi:hypothetical protein